MFKLPQFAKFTISSLISAGIDFLFFYLIQKGLCALAVQQTLSIVAATVGARILSTVVNFTINKLWSFESKSNGGRQAFLFTILFLCKMGASAGLVAGFAFLPLPTVTIKVIVDVMLFFVSFIIQKKFIF